MALYMFGVREDGSVVSIKDIDSTERGLLCNCKCPQCKRDLQACALDSQAVSRYFRHNNEEYNREGIASLNGCTATSANESGLHMMAKEILSEVHKIAFPAIYVDIARLNLRYDEEILSQLPQNNLLKEDFVFEYNEVAVLEQRYPGFRPDVSVTGNGHTFLIEIAVTHKVGADKQAIVEGYGLPMLEIDLSDYVETGITREALIKILSEETKHKKWISFPKNLVDNISQVLSAQADDIKRKREEVERQKAALAKSRAAFFEPSVYASTLRVNRDDFAFEKYAEQAFHFRTDRNNYPFFIDIPISGEVAFRCDRRIWQGQLFDRWVFNRTRDQINVFDIWKKLIVQHNIHVNSVLDGKFTYPGEDEPAYLPYKVIRKYLEHLERLGFVEVNGQWATVLEKHTTTPPCQEYADQLKAAMQQIDGCSPLSSAHLDQKIEDLQRAKREYEAELQRQRAAELREQEEKRREAERAEKEKQRAEELAKQAAEQALEQEENTIRQEMQYADYDQNDHIVYDRKGRRWIKCKFCRKAVLFNADELSSFDRMTKNKGTCYACRFKR